jgi:hypothetical protein
MLDDSGIFSVRQSCIAMRDIANDEFERRFPPNIDFDSGVVVTRNEMRLLAGALRSTTLRRSYFTNTALEAKELLLLLPVTSDLPKSSTGEVTHSLPRKKDVMLVLKAMPNLETLIIEPRRDGDDNDGYDLDTHDIWLESREPESVVFPALAGLKAAPPRLRSLILADHTFNGEDLITVLNTHHSLRIMDLRNIKLNERENTSVAKAAHWSDIYSTTVTTGVQSLTMEDLTDPGKHAPLNVLLNRSADDSGSERWSSIHPSRQHVDPGKIHDYAFFTRYAALLKGEGVVWGLEKLLDRGKHTLYHHPREEK